VNIAVNILIRNIARADFVIKMNGNDISSGVIHDLFRRPNESQSCYDLWKETAAWWFIEGEAFWWFGKNYSGGIPQNIFILDPRRMQHEIIYQRGIGLENKNRRWFYQTDTELIPILSDELIHFREWNPWNPIRGG
jgi:phage portal protein BeeE